MISMLIADKSLPRSAVLESFYFLQSIGAKAIISWSPIEKVTHKSYMAALKVAERIQRFILDHLEIAQNFNG